MESHRQQIALLHADRSDLSLVSQLLSDEPFDVVAHNDANTLQDQQFNAQVNEVHSPPMWAVVVCAHDAQDRLTTHSSPELVTEELSRLTGRYKRLVVLADSMDEANVVTYLKAGAHHVFPLQESPRLIQARLLAGLREHKETSRHELNVGPYHFDLVRRTVNLSGEPVGLSPREFEFALYLFVNRERVVPVSELLNSVWSLPETEDSRRIDTAACRLRKKMQLNDAGDWQLRRIRREGYELMRAGESAKRLWPA